MDEANAYFRKGCFAAAEIALKINGLAGKAVARTLYEKIKLTKKAALSPPETSRYFNDCAATRMIAKLTCDVMNGTRTDICKDEAIKMLCSFDEATEKEFLDNEGYSPLYIETMNFLETMKKDMMTPFLLHNDREGSWRIIGNGLRKCPFTVLWHGRIEINDVTLRPPALVYHARTVSQERISKEQDSTAARDLHAALSSAHPADLPTLRWWAAYMHIDAEEWEPAKELLHQVLFDCTTGTWPPHYLPEAMYHLGLAEFALGNVEPCRDIIHGYFDIAHAMDRNRADATLIRLWAEQRSPPRPPTLQMLCRKVLEGAGGIEHLDDMLTHHHDESERIIYMELPLLRNALSRVWDEDTFADYTWARMKASEAMSLQETSPYLPLADTIKMQWDKRPELSSLRPEYLDDFVERLVISGGRTPSVRYRKPPRKRKW